MIKHEISKTKPNKLIPTLPDMSILMKSSHSKHFVLKRLNKTELAQSFAYQLSQ